ncbi:MAG: hypothetical protein WCJ03_03950 [Bacteroidales bacterium]
METIVLKISERSKAGIALKSILEILKNQPGIEILESVERAKKPNANTSKAIKEASEGKSEPISLSHFRKQLY